MAAACDIQKGETVEYGIVRVLTNVDGNENPYVFTWSDDIPNTTWATGSGASTYYNTGPEEGANTHMCAAVERGGSQSSAHRKRTPLCRRERDFERCSFVITATRHIAAGEELLHVYKSKSWRTCFKDELS